MRIPLIFLPSLYLIVGPVMTNNFPGLKSEGTRLVMTRQFRKLMRQMISKGDYGDNEFSSVYLIEKLFALLDQLIAQLGQKSHPFMKNYQNLTRFNKAYLTSLKTNRTSSKAEKTRYKRDQAYSRVNLKRDRTRQKKCY